LGLTMLVFLLFGVSQSTYQPWGDRAQQGGGSKTLPPYQKAIAPPVTPNLFTQAHDCSVVDWSKAAKKESPEEVGMSGVYDVLRPLNFKLALPPPTQSWLSKIIKTSGSPPEHGGMWAPIETLVFLHVLTLPAVRLHSTTVVDVGVNLGYFSQLALALGYETVGFEPQERTLPYLSRTASYQHSSQASWHLFHCALGGGRGKVAMSLTEKWEMSQVDYVGEKRTPTPTEDHGSHGPEGTTGVVPMVLLSDILPSGTPIALLKVDVEGFEANVLGGARELLASVRNVVIEIKSTDDRRALIKTMGEAGFKCRNYAETYVREEDKGKEDVTGTFIDTKGKSREDITARLNKALLPCTEHGPEDFWFSKGDFPQHGRVDGPGGG